MNYLIYFTITRGYGKSFNTVYRNPDGSVKEFTKTEAFAFKKELEQDSGISNVQIIPIKGVNK